VATTDLCSSCSAQVMQTIQGWAVTASTRIQDKRLTKAIHAFFQVTVSAMRTTHPTENNNKRRKA